MPHFQVISTDPGSLSNTLSTANGLIATKYLAASGLVCILYDSFLTLDREWNLIWKRKTWDVTSCTYVFIKYGNIASMLYCSYVLAGLRGPLDNQGCKNFFIATASTALISLAAANGFLMLRLFTLWDQRKSAKIILFVAFGATYTVAVVMSVLTLRIIFAATYYNTDFQTCLINRKPVPIYGVWIAMTVFDVVAIILALSNGFHQPYRQHVEVLSRFRRDGSMYFLAAFVLRLINLICAVVLKEEFLLITLFFVWAMIAITTCRLILQVEEIRVHSRPALYYAYEMDQWTRHDSR